MVSRRVRDAGIVLFVSLLTLSVGAWTTMALDDRATVAAEFRSMDYSWYLGACEPRHTGAVVIATDPAVDTDHSDVLRAMASPGTTIVLPPGRFELDHETLFRRPRTVGDLWFLGSGRDQTTIVLRLGPAENIRRIRVEGVTIDCDNKPLADFLGDCSLVLRDCRITNYNSGAGGCNAIFAISSALLMENCEFDGREGRRAGIAFGNAFDLRVENRLFCRNTVFRNNAEIARSAAGAFDGCSFEGTAPARLRFVEKTLYIRNSQLPVEAARTVKEALDDPACLQRLAAGSGIAAAWTDPLTRKAATALGVNRGAAFWQPHLLHSSPEVRRIAAAKLGIAPAARVAVEAADVLAALNGKPLADDNDSGMVASLDPLAYLPDGPTLPPETVLAFLSDPEQANKTLEILAADPKTAHIARALTRVMNAQPPLNEMVRAAKRQPP